MGRPELSVDPRRAKALETAVTDFRRTVEETDPRKRFLHRIERQFRAFYLTRPPRWWLELRKRDPRERMIPAFASVGAIRSGTSTLVQYILQHPCVLPPLSKEPGWADSKTLGSCLRTQSAAWDIEHRFGIAMTGICNPAMTVLVHPHVIRSIDPNERIVVCLRNPTDRAFAHWRPDVGFLKRNPLDLIAPPIHDLTQITRAERESIGLLTAA